MIATSLGNALEWFDIASLRLFRRSISRRRSSPTNDQTTSLLLTFGTFGLTFLVRPIGGLCSAPMPTATGRKASLMLSIVMMTFGTLASPACRASRRSAFWRRCRLVARLVQGFSAGGEFGSSTAFLVEHHAGPARFRRELAIRKPGINSCSAGSALAVVVDPDADTEIANLGLAHPVPVRRADRPDRTLHPQLSSKTRPCRRRPNTTTPVRDVFMAAEFRVLLAARRDRGRDRRQLPHRLHADLCGQNAAPAADRSAIFAALCRRHRASSSIPSRA